jgi:hypothetical protein
MSTTTKNRKKQQLDLLREADDIIMEGWSSDLTIGETLDSMPASLRNAFLNLKFDAPTLDQDGSYTVRFTPA